MKTNKLDYNLNFLWTKLNNNFKIENYELNKSGQLCEIAWYRKLSWDGDLARRQNFYVLMTCLLQDAVERLEKNENLYLVNQGSGLFAAAIRMYSAKFPVYYLAGKITDHPDLAKQGEIVKLANKMLEFQDRYPLSKVPDGLLIGMDDPKVLHWDENIASI